jgi:hypothetical protein
MYSLDLSTIKVDRAEDYTPFEQPGIQVKACTQ